MQLKFTKHQKLKTPRAFALVFGEGQKVFSSWFLIFYRTNNLKHARLGIVVSKKNINKAFFRNRLKREVRESFRVNQHQFASLDIIVLIKKEATKINAKERKRCLNNAWQRLIVWQKNRQ